MMMLHKLIDEVEQEAFNAEDFVERLAWRAGVGNMTTKTDDNDFNPQIIHDAFTSAIRQLTDLERKQQNECDELAKQVNEEDVRYAQKVGMLIERNKDDFGILHELDEKISFVATKVVHLGDQLESINQPRCRDQRALFLMQHLNGFLRVQQQPDPLFDDPSRLFEAADIIQTLYLISQELTSTKFDQARQRIAQKHNEIERSLIERFVEAQRHQDKDRMKEVAGVLAQFKGYSQCVDAFIEQSLVGAFTSGDLFKGIVPVCECNEPTIHYVFHNPTQVMGRFLLIIFHGKLQEHVEQVLSNRTNTGRYLDRLSDLYTRTQKLIQQLAKFSHGGSGHHSAPSSSAATAPSTANSFLHKLAAKLFQPYTADGSYIDTEVHHLRQSCARQLHEYYQTHGHQKRQLRGGLGELRREAAAVIGTKTSLNIAAADNYGGETFLSEETAINLLQESQRAFKRCQTLSCSAKLATNALQLYNIISNALLEEHVDYAIELALQAVPVNEPRTEPQLYFYDVVRQTNGLVHLMEKHYADALLPLVSGSSCESEAAQRRRSLLSSLQSKLGVGVDRTLSASCAWLRVLLQTEQKRTDFRPETEQVLLTSSTQACKKVVRFAGAQSAHIKDSCDGQNRDAVLAELGERFHRVVFEHLLQFQYNTTGAMAVICDVNEYRKCAETLQSAFVTSLFETLHSLCNLLLVLPENLQDVISQTELDRSVMMNFIQLRTDYKTEKLATLLQSGSK